MTGIEFMIHTKCGLVQGGVFINTTTCTLIMCRYFGCVCEGRDYIVYSRSHNVVCTRCISARQKNN